MTDSTKGAYGFDYFEVDDDAVVVNVYDDPTENSLLILDADRRTFWVSPYLDKSFNVDRG